MQQSLTHICLLCLSCPALGHSNPPKLEFKPAPRLEDTHAAENLNLMRLGTLSVLPVISHSNPLKCQGSTCTTPVLLQDTYAAENLIQLGTLSVLPYMAELILERGLVKAVLNVVHQIAAGALAFFITRWDSREAQSWHDHNLVYLMCSSDVLISSLPS